MSIIYTQTHHYIHIYIIYTYHYVSFIFIVYLFRLNLYQIVETEKSANLMYTQTQIYINYILNSWFHSRFTSEIICYAIVISIVHLFDDKDDKNGKEARQETEGNPAGSAGESRKSIGNIREKDGWNRQNWICDKLTKRRWWIAIRGRFPFPKFTLENLGVVFKGVPNSFF